MTLTTIQAAASREERHKEQTRRVLRETEEHIQAFNKALGQRPYHGQLMTSHPDPTFNEYLRNHPVIV